MKNLFFPLFLLLFVVSCSKDSVTETSTSLEERGKEQKITVCHRTGQGEFQPISISQNALAAHLAHGDGLKLTLSSSVAYRNFLFFTPFF